MSLRKIVTFKLHINNLPADFTLEELNAIVEPYSGPIIESEIIKNRYAFVHVQDEESGQNCIKNLHGRNINGSKIAVLESNNLSRPQLQFVKLILKNVSPSTSAKEIRDLFSAYSKVIETEIRPDGEGHVHLESIGDIRSAIMNLNGRIIDGNAIEVKTPVEPVEPFESPYTSSPPKPKPKPKPNNNNNRPTNSYGFGGGPKFKQFNTTQAGKPEFKNKSKKPFKMVHPRPSPEFQKLLAGFRQPAFEPSILIPRRREFQEPQNNWNANMDNDNGYHNANAYDYDYQDQGYQNQEEYQDQRQEYQNLDYDNGEYGASNTISYNEYDVPYFQEEYEYPPNDYPQNPPPLDRGRGQGRGRDGPSMARRPIPPQQQHPHSSFQGSRGPPIPLQKPIFKTPSPTKGFRRRDGPTQLQYNSSSISTAAAIELEPLFFQRQDHQQNFHLNNKLPSNYENYGYETVKESKGYETVPKGYQIAGFVTPSPPASQFNSRPRPRSNFRKKPQPEKPILEPRKKVTKGEAFPVPAPAKKLQSLLPDNWNTAGNNRGNGNNNNNRRGNRGRGQGRDKGTGGGNGNNYNQSFNSQNVVSYPSLLPSASKPSNLLMGMGYNSQQQALGFGNVPFSSQSGAGNSSKRGGLGYQTSQLAGFGMDFSSNMNF